MDLGVKGKVAIVTGGSDGIGKAAAERLSAEGALVALVSRTQVNLDATAKEIGDITDSSKMNGFIVRAENVGVKLVACGFSLNKFKVDTTKVPDEMKTVENGILYNLQLQKKGYNSLSL